MINEPTITASCDECECLSEPMELCALAGGGWDERNIKRKLERDGWKVDGNSTICDNCIAIVESEARSDARNQDPEGPYDQQSEVE